jgi:ABC-type glycerol-3-phosphate transport system substrate-binding protein
VRRTVLAVAGLLVLAGCGGGGSSPSTPTPTVPSAVVVLDSSNFDALVLGGTKPAVVEFQSPT